MSWDVENTQGELDGLVGGTILSAKIKNPPKRYAEVEGRIIELVVRLRQPVIDADTRKTYRSAVFQVWQDEEGNGPGYIALVGFRDQVKVAA